jgi:hypothetical protein
LGDSGGLAAARILPGDTSLLVRAEAAAGVGQNYCNRLLTNNLITLATMSTRMHTDSLRILQRLFRKAVQQGRSE